MWSDNQWLPNKIIFTCNQCIWKVVLYRNISNCEKNVVKKFVHSICVFMWRVIRAPLVSLCSRTSEYSAQSIVVIRSYVNVIKMFCRFSKQSHSTIRNTESCSKRQVQWKLCIWEAYKQRCARHHAVCWWPRGQDGYMYSELTVACYIISRLLFTTDSFDKTSFKVTNQQVILHAEVSNYCRFWVFMLQCEIYNFQNFVEIYCCHLQGDWIWFR